MIYLTCPYLNLGAAYQDEEVGCLISCAKKGEADKPFLHLFLTSPCLSFSLLEQTWNNPLAVSLESQSCESQSLAIFLHSEWLPLGCCILLGAGAISKR